MAIQPGQDIEAEDFINEAEADPTPANDAGRVPKLESDAKLHERFIRLYYGDGSDGDVTISSPTVLTRDMFYNNLTVNDTLEPNGFAIFVKNKLNGSGSIIYNGATGGAGGDRTSGGNGANANANGYFRNTPGGGGGGAGRAGSAYGGGAGGTGGFRNGNAGGAGGTNGGNGATGLGGRASYIASGASGGNGGNGVSSGSSNGGGASGGGGGASGGIIFIATREIEGTFTIEAKGGNGGNGGNANWAHSGGGSQGAGSGGNKGTTYKKVITAYDTLDTIMICMDLTLGTVVPIEISGSGGGGGGKGGNNSNSMNGSGGGGGGGNGGIVIMRTDKKTNWSGSIDVSGGTGGVAGTVGGAGVNGSNGATGAIYQLI